MRMLPSLGDPTREAESFQNQLAAIHADRLHGAGFLAQRAIWTMAQMASANGATRDSVGAAAAELAAARPEMASVGNGIRLLLERLAAVRWDLAKAPAQAANLIVEVQRNVGEAARHAAAILPEDSLVLTCSHSATVVQALVAAHLAGRGVTARVLPSAGYGHRTAQDARQGGVDALVVNTLPKGATAADTVGLIGAHTVRPGESVVHGAPSLGLAKWCFDRGLPLYVVCDSLRLTTLPAAPGKQLRRGIERIAWRYVTALITEEGAQRPSRPVRKAPV